MIAPEKKQEVIRAMQHLASVCDGAVTEDGQGFNGTDVKFGHTMAAIPPEAWNDGVTKRAAVTLVKYKHQLEGVVDYDAIVTVAHADVKEDIYHLIDVADSLFIVKFSYSPHLINALRSAVHGGKWDGDAKVWRIPADQSGALKRFAEDNHFDVTQAARELMDRQPVRDTTFPATHRIEVEGAFFRIIFPYNPALVAAVKEIHSRKFDSSLKLWRTTMEPMACVHLNNFLQAHPEFVVSPEARQELDNVQGKIDEWHAEQERIKQQKAKNLEAAKAVDAEVSIPGLGGELRPFQRAGVAYAVANKRVFIGDEMGLGKTVQALATVQAQNAYPALIVSPALVKLNWQREARKWLPGKNVRVLQSRSAFYDGDVLIANYDILQRHIQGLMARGFKSIIFDESHYLKNHKAKRTETSQELVKGAEVVLCLTGTPVMNRPQELVSQLKILGRLEEFGGWYNFVRRYCNAYKDSYGWNINGAAHLEELNDKLREVCFIRRLKSEVLKELPSKQRSEIMVELSNKDEYARAEADVVNWIKERVKADADFHRQIEHLTEEIQETIIANRADAKAASAAQAETLVRIEALKQLSAEGKLEAVGEWIENFIESGEKLVVFATHKHIVRHLAERFNADSITGDTPIEKRQAAVDRFQSDPEAKVMVCNIQAGGVGITLTAASNVAFVELGWNPAAHDQAEDRCHRIGQTDSVTAYYFIGEDSIDEWIYDLIEEKRVVVDAATDGVVREKRTAGMMKDLVKKLSAKGEKSADTTMQKPLYVEMTEILNQEAK